MAPSLLLGHRRSKRSSSWNDLVDSLVSCVSCSSSSGGAVRSCTPLPPDDSEENDGEWLLGAHQGAWWTLANLPEDIKLAILTWFPDKQQALPLRAVCKSWLAAFNGSTRTITINSQLRLLPASTSRFPALGHLCVSHTTAAAADAAVKLLGLPSAATLSVLEISHTGMPEAPRELCGLAALQSLSLTSNRIKSLAASRLHLLPALRSLDLSNNVLTELPSAIGSLGTLRKLNVSDNQLSVLPESIGGLINLVTLRATNNSLVELPDSIIDLASLSVLDCSLNRLKSLPDRMTRLTGLKQLGLFGAFSHSVRNEGASTVRILAQMSLDDSELVLHVEEVVRVLVRVRRKQLALAAELAAARLAPPAAQPQLPPELLAELEAAMAEEGL